MKEDNLGDELRLIMEDETKNIEISPELMDQVLQHRKKTWRDKINDFLNKEIEIPLIPVVASLVLGIMIIIIPKDLIVREKTKVVNIGSSQIIFRGDKRVSKND